MGLRNPLLFGIACAGVGGWLALNYAPPSFLFWLGVFLAAAAIVFAALIFLGRERGF